MDPQRNLQLHSDSHGEGGSDFQGVLEDAQRLGYAEAEPSLDVDGFDAMHKAFWDPYGFWIPQSNWEGIPRSPLDIQFANNCYTIKLLATIRRPPKKCKFLYAPPILCSILAGVRDVFNPSTSVMWLGKPSIMVEERGRCYR